MKGATSIQERLWELRKDKGLNLEELSELTGISKSALGSYEKEDYKEINHGNLITLADFYGVSVDYLLCRTENREQINTPLTELHLNDEMVALLKSGRINNRLLCELATHKNFIKFLADIEIYVDGIATMQLSLIHIYLLASWEFHCFSTASAEFQRVLRSAYSFGAFAGSRISLWTIARFFG